MAGAGGGGFIFVLTKEPNMVDEVKAVIKSMKVLFCLQAKHQRFVLFVLIFPLLFSTNNFILCTENSRQRLHSDWLLNKLLLFSHFFASLILVSFNFL